MILEQRWTAVPPDQYASEVKVVGDTSRFSTAEPEPGVGVIRPSSGNAEALLELLLQERDAHPDEPFWSGVRSLTADNGAVRVEFVERVVPRLLPVVGSQVSVACHHYHSPEEQKAAAATSVG
jgi:hypothetical protein